MGKRNKSAHSGLSLKLWTNKDRANLSYVNRSFLKEGKSQGEEGQINKK